MQIISKIGKNCQTNLGKKIAFSLKIRYNNSAWGVRVFNEADRTTYKRELRPTGRECLKHSFKNPEGWQERLPPCRYAVSQINSGFLGL